MTGILVRVKGLRGLKRRWKSCNLILRGPCTSRGNLHIKRILPMSLFGNNDFFRET